MVDSARPFIYSFILFISLNSWSMTNWHAKCEGGVIANHGKKRKERRKKKRRKKDREESSNEILSYYRTIVLNYAIRVYF